MNPHLLIQGTARRRRTAFIHLSDFCLWGAGRSHACELSAIRRTYTIPALVYRCRRFEDMHPCSCLSVHVQTEKKLIYFY